MKIKNGKYKGYEFFYRMEYHLGDLKENNYSHTEDFFDNDLTESRKRALKYFHDRCEWAEEQQTFFNDELKIHGPLGFTIGQNVAFGPTLLFMYRVDGEEYDHTIIDGDIENDEDEIQEFREYEAEVFSKLGYEVPEWNLYIFYKGRTYCLYKWH